MHERFGRLRTGFRHVSGYGCIGIAAVLFVLLSSRSELRGQTHAARAVRAGDGGDSFGFDQNTYPGDDRLAALRARFAYAGYWLNNPPGARENTWVGKRAILRARGFGFAILWNGRLDAQLAGKDAVVLGRSDAEAAISAASKEGFPAHAIVFLDQEEGGRLLPEQRSYLFAWIDEIRKSQYRPGVYCSGIAVPEGAATITTAEDILSHAGSRRIALWVFNDQCPPSPGCTLSAKPLSPVVSGTPRAAIWQYAQSPRTGFAKTCAGTYASDNNCYAPGTPHDARSFLDLNIAASADPSLGR